MDWGVRMTEMFSGATLAECAASEVNMSPGVASVGTRFQLPYLTFALYRTPSKPSKALSWVHRIASC